MTDIEFLKHCLETGRITQERYNKGIVKLNAKKTAKEKYKKDKTKLSKLELMEIIDSLL